MLHDRRDALDQRAVHQDRRALAAARDHHLGPRLVLPRPYRLVGMGEQTAQLGELDQVVRAVGAQAKLARRGHLIAHPGAPPESGFRWYGLDVAAPLVAAEAAQLLRDHLSLQLARGRRVGVLQVAPATTTRTGHRTRRWNSARRGLEHADGVATCIALVSVLSDRHLDDLAGQCVPYEHDLAIDPRHAVSAVRLRAHGHWTDDGSRGPRHVRSLSRRDPSRTG